MKISVDEQKAVHAASPEVGAYLEKIGKTDLAAMTESEWHGFIAHTYATVCAEVQNIWSREVPF